MSYENRTSLLMHSAARWLVMSVVVVSPWLYGSAEPWAYLLTGLLVLAGGALWLSSLVCCPIRSFRFPALSVVLGLILALAVIQAAPLPLAMIQRVSPGSVSIARDASATWARLEPGVPASAAREYGTVSLSQAATRTAAFLFAAYLAVFLTIANCTRSWHQLRHLAKVAAICGFVMVVIALLHKFSGARSILWIHEARYGGQVFGPFTNRNHFAFHAMMIFSICVGLFLGTRDVEEFLGLGSYKAQLAWLSTSTASKLGLVAFGIVVTGAGVFLTLSRGVSVSLLAAMGIVAAIAEGLGRKRAARRQAVIAAALLVAAGLLWLGWGPVVERMSSLESVIADPASDSRMKATVDTLHIAGEFPVLGTGYGAFRHIFPMYSRPELDFGRWLHAHDDWAELLAESGSVGGLLALVAVALFFGGLARRFPTTRTEPAGFATGCLIGILGAAMHSSIDYSLHKPANAFMLAALCGMCVAAVHLSVRPKVGTNDETGEAGADGAAAGDSGADLPCGGRPGRKWADFLLRAVACAVLAIVISAMACGQRCLRAELAFKRFEYSDLLAKRLENRGQLEETVQNGVAEGALAVDNGKCGSDGYAEMARSMFLLAVDKRLQVDTRMRLAEEAERAATAAARKAPSDYLAWLTLGQTKALVGEWDASEICLERARALRRNGEKLELFSRWD